MGLNPKDRDKDLESTPDVGSLLAPFWANLVDIFGFLGVLLYVCFLAFGFVS